MSLPRLKMLTVIFTVCIAVVLSGCLEASEKQDFDFALISDLHLPSYAGPIGMVFDEDKLMEMRNQKRIVTFTDECLAMEVKPDFVMNLGDTGDSGWAVLLNLYAKLMQPLVKAGIPVYTVVGNHDHDYTGNGREDLAEFFDPLGPEMIGRSGTRYSFEHKGCHFVVLNTRPITGLIRLNPKDIAWLKNDLMKVNKDTKVFLCIHSNLPDEDTHHIVELLQQFSQPVIIYGHSHRSAITRWGGIPVVNTGALWGGTPKDGSYQIMSVREDGLFLKTRDFKDQAVTFGPEEAIVYQEPGLSISIDIEENAVMRPDQKTSVITDSAVSGTLEYKYTGNNDWTGAEGGSGKWTIPALSSAIPGRYYLGLRFTAENGSVVLAHRNIVIPGDKVRQTWSVSLGSGILSTPTLYRDMAIIPTIEGGVYALRTTDGGTAWHFDVPEGQIVGKAALDDSKVYYGAGRSVQALDALSGKRIWTTSLEGTVIAGVTSHNGKLFVPAGETHMYCLDSSNGKILWDYPVSKSVMMEASADKDKVFFGGMDGCVRALDITSGKEIWKKQWSSIEDIYTSASFWPPSVAGDKVIFGKNRGHDDEKNIAAFDVSTGNIIWSDQLSANTYRLAFNSSKDMIMVSERTREMNGVRSLSVKDGSTLWTSDTGVMMAAGASAGDLAFERDTYYLCCLKAESGELIWKYRTNPGPQGWYYGPGAFAVSETQAIVGTMDGNVIALNW